MQCFLTTETPNVDVETSRYPIKFFFHPFFPMFHIFVYLFYLPGDFFRFTFQTCFWGSHSSVPCIYFPKFILLIVNGIYFYSTPFFFYRCNVSSDFYEILMIISFQLFSLHNNFVSCIFFLSLFDHVVCIFYIIRFSQTVGDPCPFIHP